MIQSAGPPHHEANYDAERQQADALYQQKKLLEALPLYGDLRRQDPTVALFAARYGEALFAKEVTIADEKQRFAIQTQGVVELRSAQALGDSSVYVRSTVNADSKTPAGAILAGIPLSVGYTYHGSAAAQASFAKGEAAFHAQDWLTALSFYAQAAGADATWYDAALYAGDSCFRMKDAPAASIWFARAAAIDPARENRLALLGGRPFPDWRCQCRPGEADRSCRCRTVRSHGSVRDRAVGAAHRSSARHTRCIPPDFITPNGEPKIDPALATSTLDGRSSWIIYQQYRVAHGARTLNQTVVAGGWNTNGVITPNGYEHTIAEEHAALRALLGDIESKLSPERSVKPILTRPCAIYGILSTRIFLGLGSPSMLRMRVSFRTTRSTGTTTGNIWLNTSTQF